MSDAVGSHLRFLPHVENEFDTQARALLNGEPVFDDSSSDFEDWSPEKQRASYDGLRRSDANLAAIHENARTFISIHPEWIDSQANGKAINNILKAMYGDVVHTVEQFEAAYQVACANNNLKLNQVEIAKKAKAASEQRAAAERSRIVNLSEDQLENLSLEEIRRLDVEEHLRELQAAGERGGNGF